MPIAGASESTKGLLPSCSWLNQKFAFLPCKIGWLSHETPGRRSACSIWKCQVGAGISRAVLSLSTGEVPNAAAHSGALAPSGPQEWEVPPAPNHTRWPDALRGLLLLIKFKKKNLKNFLKNLNFFHKADHSYRRSAKTEKPYFQLKTCFDGCFQEAVDRNVIWTWWKQVARFAFVILSEPCSQYLLKRSYTGQEKNKLFVNIWYFQTWAL